MNVRKNARLTPCGRERIARQVVSGQTPKAVGEAAGVCPRTVPKWVDRYRREGRAGLRDRSSRPHRLYRPSHHRRPQRTKQSALTRRGTRLGVCPRRHRRQLPHRLRQGDEQREKAQCYSIPQSRSLLRQPRHQGRAYHDRQRLQLQILRQALQATWPQAHPHEAPHPKNQRQG
jgi:transposase-like protein